MEGLVEGKGARKIKVSNSHCESSENRLFSHGNCGTYSYAAAKPLNVPFRNRALETRPTHVSHPIVRGFVDQGIVAANRSQVEVRARPTQEGQSRFRSAVGAAPSRHLESAGIAITLVEAESVTLTIVDNLSIRH